MNRALLLALALLLGVALFLAGRFSAPRPIYQPGELDGEDPLEQAFADFIRAQEETIELYRHSAFFEDDQERAEAYRGLLYSLVGSIKVGALMDSDHPRFMRAVDWTSKSGLDNPDNNYYIAMIRDDADYRIIGNRGTTANMVLQLVVGQPGVRGAGSSTNVSVLYGKQLLVDAAGDFEVIVSRENPGAGVNWLANGEGAQTLLVRNTHSDWAAEREGLLRIEKIGEEGERAIPLTPARMAKGMREASQSLFDRNATWLQYAQRVWSLMPRNEISAPRATQGGLVGQYSAFGSWQLDNDQAIVLSTVPSDADYQGIELGNLWFVSLDYESHTSSLTLDQMECSADGHCYSVISHRDPGIRNWLDTEGHRRGLIMMRWQGLEAELPTELHPRAALVPFDQLRQHLPSDVAEFTPALRQQQIRRRRASVQERFGG